jgi:sec-independent protein translocase protein TatA
MGISIWQLLILLAVVILIFGTKKLKNVGGDLGSAIKGFKSAVKDGDDKAVNYCRFKTLNL